MINTRFEQTEKATPHACSRAQNKQLLYWDHTSIFQKKPYHLQKTILGPKYIKPYGEHAKCALFSSIFFW